VQLLFVKDVVAIIRHLALNTGYHFRALVQQLFSVAVGFPQLG
jgi:hypothetical protein